MQPEWGHGVLKIFRFQRKLCDCWNVDTQVHSATTCLVEYENDTTNSNQQLEKPRISISKFLILNSRLQLEVHNSGFELVSIDHKAP